MEILFVLLLTWLVFLPFIILPAIACIPSLLIWWLMWELLPDTYTLPPYRMAGLCVVLAFLSATLLDTDLASMTQAMLVLTLLWTLVLLPAGVLAKYFYAKQTGKKS